MEEEKTFSDIVAMPMMIEGDPHALMMIDTTLGMKAGGSSASGDSSSSGSSSDASSGSSGSSNSSNSSDSSSS